MVFLLDVCSTELKIKVNTVELSTGVFPIKLFGEKVAFKKIVYSW